MTESSLCVYIYIYSIYIHATIQLTAPKMSSATELNESSLVKVVSTTVIVIQQVLNCGGFALPAASECQTLYIHQLKVELSHH